MGNKKKGRPPKTVNLSRITNDMILHKRIIDVAHLVGYQNVQYFSILFHQYFGCSFKEKKSQLMMEFVYKHAPAMTDKEIAELLNVSHERIRQIRSQLGIRSGFRTKAQRHQPVEVERYVDTPIIRIKLNKQLNTDNLRITVQANDHGEAKLLLWSDDQQIGEGDAKAPYAPSHILNDVIQLLTFHNQQIQPQPLPEHIKYNPELWELDWSAINAKNFTQIS